MVIRYTKAPSNRQLKVAEEIRHSVSEILTNNDLSHPFFEQHRFTVTEVRVGPDLKLATIFLLIPQGLDHKAVIKFFNEIAPRIRFMITEKINMKYSPQIRFVQDTAEEGALIIDKIIKSIHTDEEK